MCHGVHVKVSGQLVVYPFSLLLGSGVNLSASLGGKHIYSPSHLVSPVLTYESIFFK